MDGMKSVWNEGQGDGQSLALRGPSNIMRHFAVAPDSASEHAVIHLPDVLRPLSADEICAHPRLPVALAGLSAQLRQQYLQNPRLGRTLASHQRWLLSQATLALHFEYDSTDKASGLTVGRLRELITVTSAASRNTVLNFMEEMRHYRYVQDVPHPEGARSRRRRIVVTDIATQAIQSWLLANLAILDLLDGGSRAARLVEEPQLVSVIQPLAARACLADPRWVDPVDNVGLFQWTEGGALAMDELLIRCGQNPADEEGRHSVGPINIRLLADQFLMSHTHLQRLFRKAAEAGVVGWTGARRKADLWVAASFLAEYRAWQSIKLAHVDAAYHQAIARG